MKFIPLNLFFLLSFALFNSEIFVLCNNDDNAKGVKDTDKGDVQTKHGDTQEATHTEHAGDGQVEHKGEGNQAGQKEDGGHVDQEEHKEEAQGEHKEGGQEEHKEEADNKAEKADDHNNDHKEETENKAEKADDHNNAEDNNNTGIKLEATEIGGTDAVKREELDQVKNEEDKKIENLKNEEHAEIEGVEKQVADLSAEVKAQEAQVDKKLAEINQVIQGNQAALQQGEHIPNAHQLKFNTASFNCPLDCVECANGGAKNQFCQGKDKVCKPYKNHQDFGCDEGYVQCGIFKVAPGQNFKLLGSNSSAINPQTLIVHGTTMNSCVGMLVVPVNFACERAKVTVLEKESQKIVDPNFTTTILPDGLQFDNLLINAPPGTYNLCLTQYSNDDRVVHKSLGLSNIIGGGSNNPPQLMTIQLAGTINLT